MDKYYVLLEGVVYKNPTSYFHYTSSGEFDAEAQLVLADKNKQNIFN